MLPHEDAAQPLSDDLTSSWPSTVSPIIVVSRRANEFGSWLKDDDRRVTSNSRTVRHRASILVHPKNHLVTDERRIREERIEVLGNTASRFSIRVSSWLILELLNFDNYADLYAAPGGVDVRQCCATCEHHDSTSSRGEISEGRFCGFDPNDA